MRIKSVLPQIALAVSLAGLGLVAGASPACAQSVFGAVHGRVTDSLGPAIGVHVSLGEAGFTTVTDLLGRFRFDHVPVGTWAARAYRSEAGVAAGAGVVTGVHVASDADVQVEVRLGEQRAFEAPGTEEEAGLTSRAAWSGSRLAALPVDDARQSLGYLPGVVMRGTDLGIAASPGLTIRGSGADQTSVYVDGAPARFESLGSASLALPQDGIDEASVATGVLPAVVAEARGATVAYVTRSGGPRFAAGLGAGTDGLFSRASTVGYNRFDAFAGGPVPRVRGVTWFVSAGLLGQASPYRGSGAETVPTFALAGVDTVMRYPLNPGSPLSDSGTAVLPRFAQVSGSCGQLGSDSGAVARQIRSNYGVTCRGLREDLAWTTSRRVQAKLLYSYGGGSSLSVSAIASDLQQRDAPGQLIADNSAYTGSRTASRMAVLNWAHRIGQITQGAVTLEGNLSLAADAYQSGPLDLSTELATEDPVLGIQFRRLRFTGLDGIPLPVTDAVIRELRSNTFRPPLYSRHDLSLYQAYRFNPYGLSYGFPTSGIGGEATVVSETRLAGRLGAEWLATSALTVRGGVDFSRTDLSYFDSPILSGFGLDAFVGHPRRTGAFAEARLDAGAVTLEAGARADRYVTGSDFPKVPGRIFTNPVLRTSDTSYASRMLLTFDPGRTQTLATPSLRLGFRLDDRTRARAGFSQQVVLPPYAWLFSHLNTDIANANLEVPFGRDVSLVKTTLIEGGGRHRFPSGLVLDLAAFIKYNVLPYAFTVTDVYDPFIGGPNLPNESVTLLSRTKNTRAVGGEVQLSWGDGRAVSGGASYSIVQTHLADGTGGLVPQDPLNVTSHAIAATLILRPAEELTRRAVMGPVLRGLSLALAARLTNGEAFTPLANSGVGIIAPGGGSNGYPLDEPLSEHLPWTRTLDLRLAKSFAVAGARVSVYAEARNLFDVSNIVALFAETGTTANPLFQSNLITPQLSSLHQDAGSLWITKPVTVNGVTQNVTGVDLTDCSRYQVGNGGIRGAVDCVALRRVEARWGNGDGFYDTGEINRALGAWYDALYGSWLFHGPARTARVGLSVEF